MTIHLGYEVVSEKCIYVLFQVYDYSKAQLVCKRQVELDHLREFNVHDLVKLV